jgi:peptidoglycan/xylan/chitin deacetylase (PgdA/CDA1 family)
VAPEDPRAPLDANGVRALAASPLCEIGGHTVSHPILARAPLDVQAEEIEGGCRAVEEWTGRPVRAFAYPNGRPGLDLTGETRGCVAAAAIDLAFTTEPGYARADSDALLLPRFMMTAGATAAHLLSWLHHAWA